MLREYVQEYYKPVTLADNDACLFYAYQAAVVDHAGLTDQVLQELTPDTLQIWRQRQLIEEQQLGVAKTGYNDIVYLDQNLRRHGLFISKIIGVDVPNRFTLGQYFVDNQTILEEVFPGQAFNLEHPSFIQVVNQEQTGAHIFYNGYNQRLNSIGISYHLMQYPIVSAGFELRRLPSDAKPISITPRLFPRIIR